MTWQKLDEQMAAWAMRLVSDVRLCEESSQRLATTIASEVRFLATAAKAEILAASPVRPSDRLEELQAFQGWMDLVRRSPPSPFLVRAQVITQNYISFVYLPESCFRILSKVMPSNSSTRKCARFLSDGRVRAFRNAVAHANWSYRHDFDAIMYWARKGTDLEEDMQRFEVSQEELSFWQSLSRCVAYASFSNF